MKRIVAATLLTLSTAPAYLMIALPASASEKVTVCNPVSTTNIIRNPADHSGAYEDGYSEGRRSASKGEAYQPRTVGGEFGRGFEDGYFGNRFTGQEYAVRDRVEHYTTQQCDTFYTDNPNPTPVVRPFYTGNPNPNSEVRRQNRELRRQNREGSCVVKTGKLRISPACRHTAFLKYSRASGDRSSTRGRQNPSRTSSRFANESLYI
jgi:hypothetical protein